MNHGAKIKAIVEEKLDQREGTTIQWKNCEEQEFKVIVKEW